MNSVRTSGRPLPDGPTPVPQTHPLLVLRPIHTALGAVDGLWSPLSRDLVMETDRILGELSDAIGAVTRVVYRINDWTLIHPTTVTLRNREVHFEGYWRPKYATNTFIGKNRSIELATLMPAPTPHAILQTRRSTR